MKKTEYVAPSIALFNAKVDDKKNSETNEVITEKVFNYVFSELINRGIEVELQEVKLFYNVTQYLFKVIAMDMFDFEVDDVLRSIVDEAREINGDMLVSAFLNKISNQDVIKVTVWHYNRRKIQPCELLKGGGYKDGKVCLYFTPQYEPCYVPLENFYLTTISAIGSQANELIQSFLANLVYSLSPDLLKIITFDLVGDLDNFNQIPHGVFKENFKDFNFFYPVLEWIEGEIDRRVELFKKSNVDNISAYNAINEEKLPFIVFAVKEFISVFEEYGIYSERVVEKLSQVLDKGKGTGFIFLFSARSFVFDPYHPSIRARATTAICFAINTQKEAYNAMGHSLKFGEMLVDKDNIFVNYNNNLEEKMPCFFDEREFKKLFAHIKNQPASFNEEIYNQISVKAESGEMSRRERIKNEEELIGKEFLRYLILHGKNGCVLSSLYIHFRVDYKLGGLVMERLIETGYVNKKENKYSVFSSDMCYFPAITAEQFKQIFGEDI